MISVPNRLGLMTSCAPPRMVPKRSVRVSTRPRRCCSSASRRRQFSTTITAPSTMMPKSMAPRLMRLALIRLSTMPVIVNSIDKRDDAGGDEGGAEVAQHQEQHDDDQERAFDQVLLDRPDGRLDQPGAVVDRARHDAVGQRRRDLVEPRRHALRGRPAVLADQQHGGADHGFLAVEGGGARAQRRAPPSPRPRRRCGSAGRRASR